jgi:uncharacterized protein YecE (DUF72 family)
MGEIDHTNQVFFFNTLAITPVSGKLEGLVSAGNCRVMSNLYMGCAVWSFPGWTGDIFPPGTRSKKYLHVYSHYFPAVEGNTTFYAVPQPKIIDRWYNETPDDFRFCLKLPRDYTHSGLLLPQLEKAYAFLDLVSNLQEKLALVFIQLPPKYHAGYFDDLADFLTELSADNIPLALEVRHPDWFEPENAADLQDLLAHTQMDQVILDTQAIYRSESDPNLPFICKKPDVPLITTVRDNIQAAQGISAENEAFGNNILIRFVSHPRREFNETFMRYWIEPIKNWLAEGKKVYLFIHCPLEHKSPDNARYFHQLLREAGMPIHDLPWQDNPSPEPQQLVLNI